MTVGFLVQSLNGTPKFSCLRFGAMTNPNKSTRELGHKLTDLFVPVSLENSPLVRETELQS